MKKKTQECLNNIRIRFPTYENECYAKQTRILRTMICPHANFKAIGFHMLLMQLDIQN